MTGTVKRFEQSPNDDLDYLFDFTDELQALEDTINTIEITATAGLTTYNVASTSTKVSVWCKEGVNGLQLVTCKITTNGGRTYKRSMEMVIKPM